MLPVPGSQTNSLHDHQTIHAYHLSHRPALLFRWPGQTSTAVKPHLNKIAEQARHAHHRSRAHKSFSDLHPGSSPATGPAQLPRRDRLAAHQWFTEGDLETSAL